MANYLTGSLSRLIKVARNRFGDLQLFGGLKRGSRFLSGTISRVFNLFRTTAGTLRMVGGLVVDSGQKSVKTLSGALSFAGSISNIIIRHISKSSALSFSVTRSLFFSFLKTLTGAIGTSGIVLRLNALFGRTFTGAVGFAGSIKKGLYNSYSGALSFAGDVSVSAISSIYTAVGVLGSAGAATKTIAMGRLKSASLTIAGARDYVVEGIYFPVKRTGTLTFDAIRTALQGLDAKVQEGSLQIYGRLTTIDYILDRLGEAIITPAGSRSRNLVTTRSTFSGDIDFSCLFKRILTVERAIESNILSFAGDLTIATITSWHYTATGVLNFAGSISRIITALKSKGGTISPSSITSRILALAATVKSGTLSFSGDTISAWLVDKDWKSGTLSFASSLKRAILGNPEDYGTLTMSGTISHSLVMARSPSGTLNFTGGFGKTRETLYLGPPNP